MLCVNCRGLGEARTVSNLRSLIRRYSPKIVFLLETKKNSFEMQGVLKLFPTFFGVFVDARGRAGGLGLLWDKKVTLTFLSYSLHHMDATV